MKCPYCNKEIDDTAIFCDNCGQSVVQEQKSATSEKYWNGVESDDKKRNQQYLKDESIRRNQRNSSRTKKIATFVAVTLIIISAIGIVISVSNFRSVQLDEVKENLPGKELTCSYSRTETGFWIHYYYYTLKFNDDGTLDYYYLTTVGPADSEDTPTFKGTYTYTITQNIVGNYFISFDNESFTLKVSGDNVPRSITHGK